MTKLSFEQDQRDRKYYVAYYSGTYTGDAIPPFAKASADPRTDWCRFGGRETGEDGKIVFEEGFDTLNEVREHFKQHESLYRASVPLATTGP